MTIVEPSAKGKEKRQTLSATAAILAAIAQPDASDAGRRRITSAAAGSAGVGFWAVREEAIRKEVRRSIGSRRGGPCKQMSLSSPKHRSETLFARRPRLRD